MIAQAKPRLRQAPRALRGALLPASFILSAFLAPAVDFPLRWRWSNPQPHGGNIVDMAYSPGLGLCVQVAERGQIYTSSDLDLWTLQESGTTNALRALAFLGNRILITGEAGMVLFADDPSVFQCGTLLDGPTTNWLEAAAASPSLAVAAGDFGHVYTSTNGVHWKKQTSGTSAWLRGAAYGAGAFVLVGESGTILRSTNGTAWSKRTSNTTADLNRVAFANGRFTAVGELGVALASTNAGSSWFAEQSGAIKPLHSAAAAATVRLLSGEQEVRLWNNGAWSNELARTNGPPAWTYYSSIGVPSYFRVAGHTGMQIEAFAQPGGTWFWNVPNNNVRNWLWDVMHLPAFYIAVGDFGTILSSGNGVDWTLELPPPQAESSTLLGIGGTTNLLVAVGSGGTVIYSPNLVTNIVVTNNSGIVTQTVSTLGVIWHHSRIASTNDFQAVACLNNSLYVVAGGKGSIFTSLTGAEWNRETTPTTDFLSSLVEWPGGLVAAGDNGTLLISKDGKTWTQVGAVSGNWIYKVRWLNGVLVGVGQKGTILTSSDAITWTPRVSGTQAWLSDALFIQDSWFVVGHSGTVLSSADLETWVARGTITQKSLYGAATDSRQMICVGVEGLILRSPVVPDLSPVAVLNYSGFFTNGTQTIYNLFLFGGKPDQRFTIERNTNLVSGAWNSGPQLEITDGSGALYFIETLTGTNLPAVEYYRTMLGDSR